VTDATDLAALVTRSEIGRVITLYGQLLDDHRWSEWGELFTAGATWCSAETTLVTRPAIVDGMRAMQGPRPGPVKHVSFPPVVDVESATSARAWTDFAVMVWHDDRWRVASAGRYHDHLVVDGDRWRFARRSADIGGAPDRPLPPGADATPAR
jgi:hypothetical protein